MASSVMLSAASQSALCLNQVGDNDRFQSNFSCKLKLHRYALFPNGNLSISRTTLEKHRFGIQYDLLGRNFFTSTSKSPNKYVAFAALPSLPSVEIASNLFTLGTAFVIPFYTVMILAPNAKLTRKLVESSLPYVILGAVYLYLLVLSWSPETLKLMFASKYWLPELPGITRMFSSTLTVASAWIHLLAVDLYAGRQIYLDGQQNDVETRHSLTFCLLFCPVGILSHYVTKTLVLAFRKDDQKDEAKLYS